MLQIYNLLLTNKPNNSMIAQSISVSFELIHKMVIVLFDKQI